MKNNKLLKELENNLKKYSFVYLTGKAGTGKSTLLKSFIKKYNKDTVITSTTGISAQNIWWVTLHSIMWLDIKCKVNKINPNKVNLKYKKYLIIDEVSMLSSFNLDTVESICSRSRKIDLNNIKKATDILFWWLKVLIVWDPKQLWPIIRWNNSEEEWMINSLSKEYKSFEFYDAKIFKNFYKMELSKVWRQSDMKFINILNEVREWNINYKKFNRYNNQDNLSDSLFLYGTNREVDMHNLKMLDMNKNKEYIFEWEYKWSFKVWDCLSPKNLVLKKWVKVIITANYETIYWELLYNGMRWFIRSIDEDNDEIILDIKWKIYYISRYNFEKNEYINGKLTSTWTFKQFPLKIAYSMTFHKVQWLTVESNIVIKLVKWWDYERANYVAISRATSMDNIYLI